MSKVKNVEKKIWDIEDFNISSKQKDVHGDIIVFLNTKI